MRKQSISGPLFEEERPGIEATTAHAQTLHSFMGGRIIELKERMGDRHIFVRVR